MTMLIVKEIIFNDKLKSIGRGGFHEVHNLKLDPPFISFISFSPFSPLKYNALEFCELFYEVALLETGVG